MNSQRTVQEERRRKNRSCFWHDFSQANEPRGGSPGTPTGPGGTPRSAFYMSNRRGVNRLFPGKGNTFQDPTEQVSFQCPSTSGKPPENGEYAKNGFTESSGMPWRITIPSSLQPEWRAPRSSLREQVPPILPEQIQRLLHRLCVSMFLRGGVHGRFYIKAVLPALEPVYRSRCCRCHG